MREIHDLLFEKATEGMTAEEVLNYYRNLYHAEPQSTEHGIVANALNDILPRMILPPCKVVDTDYKILYEHLLEDFEHVLYFAGKNNNVCNFCEHDCGESGTCKGREDQFECQPKWRGIVKSEGSEG